MYITKTNIFDIQNLQILSVNWNGIPHSYETKIKTYF